MKKLGFYILTVLVITILLPTVIVKTFNFVPKETPSIGVALEKETPEEKSNKRKKKRSL